MLARDQERPREAVHGRLLLQRSTAGLDDPVRELMGEVEALALDIGVPRDDDHLSPCAFRPLDMTGQPVDALREIGLDDLEPPCLRAGRSCLGSGRSRVSIRAALPAPWRRWRLHRPACPRAARRRGLQSDAGRGCPRWRDSLRASH